MTDDDLLKVNARLTRMIGRLERKSSVGFTQSFVASDGKTHNVHVNNIKSFEEYEDDLRNAIIWAWSIKDYLKEVSISIGKPPSGIENIVDRHHSLQILSDLANSSKHGTLKYSRSNHFAFMEVPQITIPQVAISSITFGAFDVITEVSNPGLVQYEAVVISRSGDQIDEAGKVLRESIEIWESEGVEYATVI